MGAKQKRGKKGSAAQYLTRTQALRKLQLSLPEFRRLCILKGIHPREPRKKPKGASKTYYHVKDLAFLLHEPLLAIFRSIKAFQKKINRAKVKQQLELAEKLYSRRPQFTLDHLVRERYPTFIDAIRDLDDPLCMISLFAALPASKGYQIPVDRIHASRRVYLEWQAYVAHSRCLSKVFVAVKGFYYQAQLSGQTVTWLVPHERNQVLPSDVDYRVMITFLEFYETMMKFMLFKLYHDIGLRYPPTLDSKLESAAAGLNSVVTDIIDTKEPSEVPAAEDDAEKGNLFQGLIFFLSRETPKESLAFVIKSFGGKIAWDGEGSQYSIESKEITHHVIDRPSAQNLIEGREYLQPQWVYDSVNFKMLVPVDLYAPGKTLPPHLSPFVDDEKEGYKPDFAKVIEQLKASSEQSVSALKEDDKPKEVEEDVENARDELKYQADLKAEVAGKGPLVEREEVDDEEDLEQEEKEEEDMDGMLMTNKDKKLYSAIKKSKKNKRERVAKLIARNKKLKSSNN